MNDDTRTTAILVDIDGVLCDVAYHPMDAEDFTWGAFVKADLEKRERIDAGITLVKCLVEAGCYPVFLTARPEYMRYQTEKMLAEYGFHGICYMADNKTARDGDRAYHVRQMQEKWRIIVEDELQIKYNFLYAIDDQKDNARLFNSLGIPTMQARFL